VSRIPDAPIRAVLPVGRLSRCHAITDEFHDMDGITLAVSPNCRLDLLGVHKQGCRSRRSELRNIADRFLVLIGHGQYRSLENR
jgi:hypothetical protein